MPRNKGKGGKKFRKSKNNPSLTEKRQLEFKEEQQEYALVTKMLGNGRCECKCYDGRTRLGVIRGSMSKRVWISVGDTILVSLREYQDDKADIIHKYTNEEAATLREYGELGPGLIDAQLPSGVEEEENEIYDEIKFEDI